MKVVQRSDSGDDRRERRRDRRIVGVGPVLLVVYDILMNLRVKRRLYLGRGAGKLDNGAPCPNLLHLKTMRPQPLRYHIYILLRGAVHLAKLRGREPMVVFRRGPIQLMGHETFKGRFLSGAALEDEQHVLHREA